ncbi:hypothetical protein [Nocardia neocaledoniensis]|uniref:hypothetical protein n=1 Tax=Nocardia neocaledoniensis TaxID=236511 RepID=UPI002456153D|nr:hypothetical protein [Nocardia neocaledoniensis]
MSTVRRYWIEFEFDRSGPLPDGPVVRLYHGVGVTGFDERDALSMVADMLPGDEPLPPVRRITPDISLADLPPLSPPCFGVCVWRGVWFPPDNLRTGPTWRPRGVVSAEERAARFGHPTPVVGPSRTWWDDIPHIRRLGTPLMWIHQPKLGRDRWESSVDMARILAAEDPSHGDLLREALGHMISQRPTPDEWFDPIGAGFADQEQLVEYLQAFHDYLFGDRPAPIPPPGIDEP